MVKIPISIKVILPLYFKAKYAVLQDIYKRNNIQDIYKNTRSTHLLILCSMDGYACCILIITNSMDHFGFI